MSPMHSVKVADDDDRICLHGGQLTTEHGLSYRAAARTWTVEREQCPLRAEQSGRVGGKIKLRQLATVANLDHLSGIHCDTGEAASSDVSHVEHCEGRGIGVKGLRLVKRERSNPGTA